MRGGAKASIATAAFSGGPAGTAVFGTDKATKRALEDAADDYGLDFGKLGSGSLPTLEAIERVPRIRVMSALGNAPTGSTAPTPRPDQSVWVLRQLGFDVDPTNVAQLNTAATDPLAGYDLLYNAASNYPANNAANAQSRARLRRSSRAAAATSAARPTGANFLTEVRRSRA